jgi:glycine/serine hydroxymethyltransferase
VRALVAGVAPRPVHLQRRALFLMSTGHRSAIGTRNGIVVEGRWVWRLKDHLDRSFISRLKGGPGR